MEASVDLHVAPVGVAAVSTVVAAVDLLLETIVAFVPEESAVGVSKAVNGKLEFLAIAVGADMSVGVSAEVTLEVVAAGLVSSLQGYLLVVPTLSTRVAASVGASSKEHGGKKVEELHIELKIGVV
jgi:hypothetical protein